MSEQYQTASTESASLPVPASGSTPKRAQLQRPQGGSAVLIMYRRVSQTTSAPVPEGPPVEYVDHVVPKVVRRIAGEPFCLELREGRVVLSHARWSLM
jgi:hypothetical protein